jgi:dihydrofolate synthase / folylpolyglutamate synthase
MRFECLDDWLAWQESLNPKEIDLGLDRVNRVLERAGLPKEFNCPLITVAGTNGKGSVVAMLEAIAAAAGLNVCSYTSPHIFRYNERIKINTRPVDDVSLCKAFEHIDKARGDIPLTYFEFGTLAAIDVFFRQQPDLVILEVGLGGRLDAVNVMDADVSIVTSIAIDHIDWLGDDREAIGFEKAGIFRSRKTVVCGELDPPQSVVAEAGKKQCRFLLAGRDFDVLDEDNSTGAEWRLNSPFHAITGLPAPGLKGDFQKFNAATAIVALQAIQNCSLLDKQVDLDLASKSSIAGLVLAGRFQKLQGNPDVFVDVAHNPHAASALASQLKLTAGATGRTWAIVAMLADKDVAGVLEKLVPDIDICCIAGLGNVARGLTAEAFLEKLPEQVLHWVIPAISAENRHDLAVNQCTMLSETVLLSTSVAKACQLVLSKADITDRIIIFGSFYTVTEAMQFFSVNNDILELKN